MGPVVVRTPASTANLGSGYDAFGLALASYDTVTAEFAPEWSIEIVGEGSGTIPTDSRSLVLRAMRAVFESVGDTRNARVHCHNRVPYGKGMGSSSAAIVGGLVAANALTGDTLDDDVLLRMATVIEGHPDNVAAALLGGFTICWSDADGSRAARIEPSGGLAAVCVPSGAPFSTKSARKLLPEVVPHADGAFNASRASLLATGIALGRPELMRVGMHDRLHEPYRAAVVTDLEQVRDVLLAAGADGAALSGAGPTVLGLVHGSDDEEAYEKARVVASNAALPLAGVDGRRPPMALRIDRCGATVVPV